MKYEIRGSWPDCMCERNIIVKHPTSYGLPEPHGHCFESASQTGVALFCFCCFFGAPKPAWRMDRMMGLMGGKILQQGIFYSLSCRNQGRVDEMMQSTFPGKCHATLQVPQPAPSCTVAYPEVAHLHGKIHASKQELSFSNMYLLVPHVHCKVPSSLVGWHLDVLR